MNPVALKVAAPRAVAALMIAALSGTASQAVEPSYIPGGVIDAAGAIGCLRTPAGGVETVDLATGRTLWRSREPSRALLVDAERVFVLEERAGRALRVARYEARDGRLVRAYDLPSLDLPPWASLAEPAGARESTSFQAGARLEGNRLEVHYEATLRRVYGIRPPGDDARAEGTVRILLDSGRVEPHPGSGPPAAPMSDPAAALPGVRLISAHARVPDTMIVLGAPPPNVDGALLAGDRRYAFELSADAKVVTVHRWKASSGGNDQPLRIEHGQATDAVWATLDRRHVLLRRADDQRWYDLYVLDTGSLTGTLEAPVDVAVAGHRIFWTAFDSKGRVVLHATDTGTGRIVWRRTVRDPDPPPGAPIP